jgi:hypothetical protein
MHADQPATQTESQFQLSGNSRYIEVQYNTKKGYATPHFHPSEEELLEKRLKSLYRRHIPAIVINLLTKETVGAVEEGDPWVWWYCPEGIDAKEQPANSKKIVCHLSHL